MRPEEAKDLGKLVGVVTRDVTHKARVVHTAILDRAYRGLRLGLGRTIDPLEKVHKTATHAVYSLVDVGLVAATWGAGEIGARRACDTMTLTDSRGAHNALAVLNGYSGDRLADAGSTLSLAMSLRHDGRDLATDRDALSAAYPYATGRVVVFLHGLVENENSWHWRALAQYGNQDVTYGSRLEHDLGVTALWLRYNTGLRISANGRSFADLLQSLVAQWPVPLTELILVGHSMGGLVLHSALIQGEESGDTWVDVVGRTVALGSPGLGAPLERSANRITPYLASRPETGWLADVLRGRSVGIKDLRHGNVLEEDWSGHHPDDPANRRTTLRKLRSTAAHYAILGTVTTATGGFLAERLGDLLVSLHSGRGASQTDRQLVIHDDHIAIVGGVHHLDLLNHPKVYPILREWIDDSGAVRG